mmetsp:Transcript_18310/g.45865  ORF Transcript_18310/g.45865 Transcript_18310/m.45865 type:complete len:185 (+) Transcript_18310:230-784(+)|eukprot:CAMPEP_0113871852 /NCGR_PEP_ID=MMETSP0780_2-20120614/2876_1 /TAXON_ID=652834 /ORGANISM="Palpitomonas bilix" /LENGTH=184 /DNA_ID=CAMNT_0000857295 /DNA_START=220 /DNA_END=774 /DNA_ORIENTATION=+ /assembly_acc=CAM_ASM_000599
MRYLKCVAVGDGAVGKTSMLISYTTNQFPGDYVPTVYDNFTTTVMVDNETVNLGLWDTAGQDEFAHVRKVAYPNADLFFIIFSVVSPDSFENVTGRWVPELKGNALDKVPFFLIGNKTDMREGKDEGVVTRDMGAALAKRIGAAGYMECSALTQEGLTEVFTTSVRHVLFPPAVPEEKGCCTIL